MYITGLIAALAASILAGIVLHLTGWIGAVATLYNLSGEVMGWVLVLVHGMFAGVVFVGIVLPIVGTYRDIVAQSEELIGPIPTAGLIGALFGLVLWIFLVIAVPVWAGFYLGADMDLPYLNLPALLALLVFGALLGGSYPVIDDLLT